MHPLSTDESLSILQAFKNAAEKSGTLGAPFAATDDHIFKLGQVFGKNTKTNQRMIVVPKGTNARQYLERVLTFGVGIEPNDIQNAWSVSSSTVGVVELDDRLIYDIIAVPGNYVPKDVRAGKTQLTGVEAIAVLAYFPGLLVQFPEHRLDLFREPTAEEGRWYTTRIGWKHNAEATKQSVRLSREYGAIDHALNLPPSFEIWGTVMKLS